MKVWMLKSKQMNNNLNTTKNMITEFDKKRRKKFNDDS